uniref:Uncharacterized protein n=1 Tax=Anguilla anguilla TaxID=7936 RepID=A0A0E9UHE9_ANGAN
MFSICCRNNQWQRCYAKQGCYSILTPVSCPVEQNSHVV